MQWRSQDLNKRAIVLLCDISLKVYVLKQNLCEFFGTLGRYKKLDFFIFI